MAVPALDAQTRLWRLRIQCPGVKSINLGFGGYYMSPSYSGVAFSPFYGSYNYYATPGYMGYSFNPYMGYRTFMVPGMTYSMPSGYGYSAGYVPTGYGY